MFQAPGRDRAGWAVQGCACMMGCSLVVMALQLRCGCPGALTGIIRAALDIALVVGGA